MREHERTAEKSREVILYKKQQKKNKKKTNTQYKQ